jgi:hypothetical protein
MPSDCCDDDDDDLTVVTVGVWWALVKLAPWLGMLASVASLTKRETLLSVTLICSIWLCFRS